MQPLQVVCGEQAPNGPWSSVCMCVYRQGTMLIPDIVHRAFMTHYKFAVTVACIVLWKDRKY